jgi:hypothetical protein
LDLLIKIRIRLLRNLFDFKEVVKNVMRNLENDPIGHWFPLHSKEKILFVNGIAKICVTTGAGSANPNRVG